MNKIYLHGIINNIQRSHTVGDVEYDKATILVQNGNGTDSTLNLKFKRFSNPYKDGDKVDITGNIRSYSKKLPDGKSKVDVYVFTYFDRQEPDETISNRFEIDGNICKIQPLKTLKNGKCCLQFILANNIINQENTSKLNSYLPTVVWGTLAKEMSSLQVGDKIHLTGELHSREYTKVLPNGEIELRVAHELVADNFDKL